MESHEILFDVLWNKRNLNSSSQAAWLLTKYLISSSYYSTSVFLLSTPKLKVLSLLYKSVPQHYEMDPLPETSVEDCWMISFCMLQGKISLKLPLLRSFFPWITVPTNDSLSLSLKKKKVENDLHIWASQTGTVLSLNSKSEWKMLSENTVLIKMW